ncbi:MAG: NHLP family bacteriocin export ABC transporter peptidase/permease/ATPase subunit [Clostridia bacterium]|nr:NHLP family bacteriocin export ABC transporter peptidase/permease/ATPase subunit [Clostridia bacterium]
MAKSKKVPVIMQMEALECGAASLAMIMAYYGKWVSLDRARAACGISRDGASAKDLVRAAREYGMEVKAYRAKSGALEKLPVPSILFWDHCHFVVYCGVKGKTVSLNDPARGRVKVSLDEFEESFSEVVIYPTPGDQFVADGQKPSVMAFARKKLKGAAAAIVVVALISLLDSAVGIVEPALQKVFTDSLLPQYHPEWVEPFMAIMVGVLIFSLVISWLKSVYLLRVKGRFAIEANCTFLWRLLCMPMRFYSQRYAGDLISRQRDNAGITDNLIDVLAPIAINAVMMILYLTVMLRYSVTLTLVGIATAVINMIVAQISVDKTMDMSRVAFREAGMLDSVTMSGIEMIETIKASGAEAGYFERWSGYQASESYESNRMTKINAWLGAIPQFVSELADLLVLVIGAWLIMHGEFTAGTLLAFQSFLTSFLNPVSDLTNAGTTIQTMRASMERVEDVMTYPTDVNPLDANPIDDDAQKLSGDIVIEDVTFGYTINQPPVIKNFSLRVKPGQKVALVGSSGSGKSTITNLLSGLYEPWSGSITIDGKPLKSIDRFIFTSSVAVVTQDITLFEDTVANNIKMFDDSIESYDVILAANDARLHSEIMAHGGYSETLIEGGRNFSGGQRQRMEIARALAQDPTIIILDEATSALDAKTEYEVIQRITQRGITCVIVAHRLSTIRDCDEIVVLQDGVAVERGTHEQLLNMGGLYEKLITTE